MNEHAQQIVMKSRLVWGLFLLCKTGSLHLMINEMDLKVHLSLSIEIGQNKVKSISKIYIDFLFELFKLSCEHYFRLFWSYLSIYSEKQLQLPANQEAGFVGIDRVMRGRMWSSTSIHYIWWEPWCSTAWKSAAFDREAPSSMHRLLHWQVAKRPERLAVIAPLPAVSACCSWLCLQLHVQKVRNICEQQTFECTTTAAKGKCKNYEESL